MSATQAISRAFRTWDGVFKSNPCIKGEFIGAPEVKNDFKTGTALIDIMGAASFLKSRFAQPLVRCVVGTVAAAHG